MKIKSQRRLVQARYALLIGTTIGFMTAGPFATKATQTEERTYAYEPISVVFLAELLKLLFSIGAYWRLPGAKQTHGILGHRDIAHYAVPAMVYCVNNVLLFFIVQHIQPSAFQLLSQLKVIFTAVLVRLLLDRQLTIGHYLALLSLALGAAVSRLSRLSAPSTPSEPPSVSTEWYGVVLTIVSCLASSIGGVLNEKVLKKDGALHSVHLANTVLYCYGVMLNGILLIARCAVTERRNPFSCYNGFVVLLVLLTTVTGLAISFLLKWLDNLVRCLAHSCAMLLSMTVEAAVLATMPSPQLLLAIGIVAVSTAQYAREGPPLPCQTRRMVIVQEKEEESC